MRSKRAQCFINAVPHPRSTRGVGGQPVCELIALKNIKGRKDVNDTSVRVSKSLIWV